MSIARAVLVGTLEQEPEKRFTPQNVAVTTVWIAVPGRQLPSGQTAPATRVKLSCWRGLAEMAGQLQKGQVVMVEGKLTMPNYQGQDGVQRKHFELEVNTLSVVPGLPTPMMVPAGAGANAGGGGMAAASAAGYASSPVGGMSAAPGAQQAASAGGNQSYIMEEDDLYTEEDIPF